MCKLHTHVIHTFGKFCPYAPAPGMIGNIRLYGNTKHCFVDALPYALHRFHGKGVGRDPRTRLGDPVPSSADLHTEEF